MSNCIQDLVARQAAVNPSAIALSYREARVSYRNLENRADGILQQLRRQGVEHGEFVGICLPRSPEAVVAMLGVLKAGGAYLYLEPEYPALRLRFMAGEAAVRFVLTTHELASKFEWAPAEPILIEDGTLEERQVESPGLSLSSLDDPAYLIFTSGSTGPPNGTIGIHRSLVARLTAAPLPDIQSSDVCALNSSLAFGISASRVFLPLALGATVVMFSNEDVWDVERFCRLIHSNRVTSMFMVPALLRQFLALMPHEIAQYTTLRAITVAGGALTPEICEAFAVKLPNVLLINSYGSSEIGTTASQAVYRGPSAPKLVTIGKAIPGTEMYVLDEDLQPVNAGEIGELCVSAKYLATGYLKHPELTNRKFIRNHFSPDPTSRLYRTGDLARALPNGELEFKGRIDDQVKIRGFRIELGEIEALLQRHPDVTDVAVIAKDGGSDKQLHAFMAVSPNGTVDANAYRRFAQEHVPEHMIPSYFSFVAQLPRTDAGKIDKRTLAASLH
jgi:amino acid adenylation domain-containing protein